MAAFAPGGGRPWEPQSLAHGPLGPSTPLPTAEPRRREAGGVHGRTPPSPEGETDRVCAVIRWGSQGREGADPSSVLRLQPSRPAVPGPDSHAQW